MKTKMKILFSIGALVLFGLFAMASFGPDTSTNTYVAIKDCKSEPAFSGNVTISISYKDKMGVPIPNATGRVYIWKQETTDDGTCMPSGFTSPLDEEIFTDAAGNFFINGYPYTFDNSEDLHRVELVIDKTALRTGCREVQVRKYGSSATFTFNCVGLRLNEL